MKQIIAVVTMFTITFGCAAPEELTVDDSSDIVEMVRVSETNDVSTHEVSSGPQNLLEVLTPPDINATADDIDGETVSFIVSECLSGGSISIFGITITGPAPAYITSLTKNKMGYQIVLDEKGNEFLERDGLKYWKIFGTVNIRDGKRHIVINDFQEVTNLTEMANAISETLD